MNSQKGFIQIPILIAIIIGVIVVGGAGYVGVQQYQNHQTEKPRQETVAQSSQATSTPTSTPEISEIEKLRQEVENLRKQQFSPKQTQVPSSFIKQPVANTSPKLGALSNAEIIKRVKPATVYIQSDDGSGSGMIIEADGFILTNAHVVKGFTNVHVTLQSNEVYPAVVIGRDENADLAVLKINGDHFPMVQFGDSNKVNQGDEVFTFGFPFGIEGDVSFKEGTVSRRIEGYFETSAEIHPGNSGGPLVNIYGQVVGVNTAIFGKSISGIQLGETIKLAIPINTAKDLIPKLKEGLSVTVAPEQPRIDAQKLCIILKNEFIVFDNIYSELSKEYLDLVNFMLTPDNLKGLTGADYLNESYKNWIKIYDEVRNKARTFQEKSINTAKTYFANANQDDLKKMHTSFAQSAIYLKAYYDSHLETLQWITTNAYWDDYLKIKMAEALDADFEFQKKAFESNQTAKEIGQNIKKNYADLIAKYKCQ